VLIAALLVLPLVALGVWRLSASDNGNGSSDSNNASASSPPQCETPDAGWNSLVLSDRANSGVAKTSDSSQLSFGVESGASREVQPGKWRVILHTTMKNSSNAPQDDGDWLYDFLIVGDRTFTLSCFSGNPAVVASRTVGDALVGFDVRCPPSGLIELAVDNGPRINVTSSDLPPSQC
jgi:hypothetical protein